MKEYELYAILDKELLGNRDLIEAAKELINKGVQIIQYRDKISTIDKIRKNSFKLKEADIPALIINDYPEIAKEVDAGGVHLGQDDMDIAKARGILGKDKLIGKSTHSLQQAIEAQNEGADYIGIGPVFHTNTKKNTAPIGTDVLKEAVERVTIPVVAIGGINQDNLDKVLATCVKRVAMASAILTGDFKWDKYKKPKEAISLKK